VSEGESEGIQVPLVWVGAEDVPILYANTFISQFDQSGGFIVTAGQMNPPALIGTPDEMRAQAEQVTFVPVRVAARLALTQSKMLELVQVLQLNLEQFESMNKMKGDPRE